jgi:hypothetical protein
VQHASTADEVRLVMREQRVTWPAQHAIVAANAVVMDEALVDTWLMAWADEALLRNPALPEALRTKVLTHLLARFTAYEQAPALSGDFRGFRDTLERAFVVAGRRGWLRAADPHVVEAWRLVRPARDGGVAHGTADRQTNWNRATGTRMLLAIQDLSVRDLKELASRWANEGVPSVLGDIGDHPAATEAVRDQILTPRPGRDGRWQSAQDEARITAVLERPRFRRSAVARAIVIDTASAWPPQFRLECLDWLVLDARGPELRWCLRELARMAAADRDRTDASGPMVRGVTPADRLLQALGHLTRAQARSLTAQDLVPYLGAEDPALRVAAVRLSAYVAPVDAAPSAASAPTAPDPTSSGSRPRRAPRRRQR